MHMDLFEVKLQRSDYKEDFKNNQELPKKYYKFPLCNVDIDFNHHNELLLDNNYQRCSGTLNQLKELDPDIKTTFDVSKVNETTHIDLWKWCKAWHLKNPLATLNIQKPGQQFPFHMDSVESYTTIPNIEEKRKRLRRVLVMLETWSPGQVIILGTKTISHWKKGDVIWFDWYHVPHGTANFSRTVRPLLQITGETTPEFEKLFG